MSAALFLSLVLGSTTTSPVRVSTASAGTFIENRGQWAPTVKYLGRLPGVDVWVTSKGVAYDFYKLSGSKGARVRAGTVVRMDFVGGGPAKAIPGTREPGTYNYILGSDPKKWVRRARPFADVSLREIYKGIDAVEYFADGRPRYDLVVKPGADPNRIAMRLEGAPRPHVAPDGRLVAGDVQQIGLLAYQLDDARKQPVTCAMRVDRSGAVRVKLGDYDRLRPLIVDPFVWSTYLGANADQIPAGMDVDTSGNIVVCGSTTSADFPTTLGAYQRKLKYGYDVFASKLSADGSQLIWSTYLGGRYDDMAAAVAFDSLGRPVVAGTTLSTDFPTTPGAYDRTPVIHAGQTANNAPFVTKLSADGSSLVWSTLGPGTGGAFRGLVMHLGPNGNPYVGGYTDARDLPTTPGAYQPTFVGTVTDGFVEMFSSDGSQLPVCTYLPFVANDLAIESQGNVLMAGTSPPKTLPITPGAYQPSTTAQRAGFLAVLSANGASILSCTYLSGSQGGPQLIYAVTLDGQDNPTVVGGSADPTSPTSPGAYQPTFVGTISNGFVTKLSKDLTSLMLSTFIGGDGESILTNVRSFPDGSLAVLGWSAQGSFPITSDAVQPTSLDPSYYQMVVCRLSADFSQLDYSTFLGGSSGEYPTAISAISTTDIVILGSANSIDLPTTAGALQGSLAGSRDAYLARISINPAFALTTATPNTLGGGTPSQGMVRLAHIAGAGGVTVALSRNSSSLSLPASVTVAEGSQSANFAINTFPITSDRLASITASALGSTTVAKILVKAYRPTLVPSPTTIVGGNPIAATLNLNVPAPPGGKVVSLSNNTSSVAAVPASVTVSAGATSTTFKITSYGTSYVHYALITATVDGGSNSVYVKAIPASLSSVQLVQSTLKGGQSTTGRAYLDGESGGPLTVTLSSNNGAAHVPASVTIPNQGALSFAFAVTTDPVATTQTATVSATLNGVTKTTTLTINP